MQAGEIGQVRHEKVGRQERRQRDPQKSARALIPPEDTRLQLAGRSFHLLGELDDFLACGRQAIARRPLLEDLHPEPLLELSDAPEHGRVVHAETLGGGPYRAATPDGEEVANIVPVDLLHGAILHRDALTSTIPSLSPGVPSIFRIVCAPPMCVISH
jgi:hypothetical protein